MNLSRYLASAAFAASMLAIATPAHAACDAATAADHPAHARANPDAVRNMLTQADAALGAHNYAEACPKYRMVLSVDPANIAARTGLGEGALGEGDYASARSHFQSVIDAAPDDATALEGAGLARTMSGDLAGAEPLLRHAVQIDARRWRSWNALGVIADAHGDGASADAAWVAAIAAAPNEAAIYNNKGMSLLQRNEAAGARDAFDRALQLNPGLTTAASNRRIALATLGQYDAALAGVSDQDLPATLNNVAVIAARRGDRAVADRLLAAAITASPQYYELAVRNRDALSQAQPAHHS